METSDAVFQPGYDVNNFELILSHLGKALKSLRKSLDPVHFIPDNLPFGGLFGRVGIIFQYIKCKQDIGDMPAHMMRKPSGGLCPLNFLATLIVDICPHRKHNHNSAREVAQSMHQDMSLMVRIMT